MKNFRVRIPNLYINLVRLTSEYKGTEGENRHYRYDKKIKAPYYRRTSGLQKSSHMLNEEFPNRADVTGAGARLYDYYEMGELVRALPTVAEKIQFVNPYERPWKLHEKKWHRAWMPALFAQRKAWNVNVIPHYFDCLDFYKYITKTRIEDGLMQWYDDIVLSTKRFEASLLETVALMMENQQNDTRETRAKKLLRNIMDTGLQILASAGEIRDYRVSYASRCESFWIRSGFLGMYEKDDFDQTEIEIDRFNTKKFIGDDRRRLGELSFVVRDDLVASIRRKVPPTPLIPFSDTKSISMPIFDENFVLRDLLLSPVVYNLRPDTQPLYQCAGYEPDSGDDYCYGQIAFRTCNELDNYCSFWKVSGDEEVAVRKESLASAAVASLFSWLNGQAHSKGFTQYNDIDYPFVSQLVLSDGMNFFFAVAQLNTIAINIDVEGFVNDKTNVCYVEGPFKLFDEFDREKNLFYYFNGNTKVVGLNPKVLSRLLQMMVRE